MLNSYLFHKLKKKGLASFCQVLFFQFPRTMCFFCKAEPISEIGIMFRKIIYSEIKTYIIILCQAGNWNGR